jgi:phage pi2 protein 07
MFYLATTRFNNSTLLENIKFKEKEQLQGVIYGTTIKINARYPFNTLFFVVEMNNEKNEIYGISLIRNSLVIDKQYIIYENHDYNRFIYRGDYWISRDEILLEDRSILDVLEPMLFKGKSNLKRISGIAVITNKLFLRWNFNEYKMKEQIKNLFIIKFKNRNLII